MQKFWEIYDQDDTAYKIMIISKKGIGDKMTANFNARPLFFDYMDTRSIMRSDGKHFRHDGSMTARNTFNKIFEGTPFDYVLVDSFNAVDWQNFGGGETKLKSFTRAIDRIGAEFEIVGNTVFIRKLIGRDTSIQYRYKLNASNIKQEIDGTKQITGIIGYADFEAEEGSEGGELTYLDAKIFREYISPLADVIDNEIRWGFFEDSRIKSGAVLEKAIKDIVDNSLHVSFTADIVNLRDQGYPIDVSQAGDRVFLIDPRIKVDQEVRVQSQSITKNWKGEIIDAQINFGSQGLGKRFQSNITSAVNDIGSIKDAFGDNMELPMSFIDKRVQRVTEIIDSNQSSVFDYMSNGVIGYNGDDPNYMTKYVGDALAFSDDGGNTWSTFMSAKYGINARYITAGELRGINIYQESSSGGVSIENGEVESFIGGKKAMKWGGWKQEFYNPDETLIGSLEPTRLLNSEHYGLSLTVTNDFLTIGHWINGQRRPVFRTQEIEGRKSTYVLGVYDNRGQNNHTELVLGANSNIGLSTNGIYNRYSQASIILRNKPQEDKGNSISLYFGGISQYRDQEFSIRANIDANTSRQVAVFREEEIRLDTDKVYFNGTSASVEKFDEGIYLFASGDNRSGLKLWNGGQVDVISQGVPIHQFYSSGTKSGGSIEIDGKRLGMSPIDSPQTLIEYIEFNVNVNKVKKVYLDKNYIKTISDYAVFSSNKDVIIVDKQTDHFIIKGEGIADFRIVGKRKGYQDAFWNDMSLNEGA